MVCWRGHGFLGFESASALVPDTYGDTFAFTGTAVAGTSRSGLVDDDDDWNLGDIPLLENADLHGSLHVDFTALQTQGRFEPCRSR